MGGFLLGFPTGEAVPVKKRGRPPKVKPATPVPQVASQLSVGDAEKAEEGDPKPKGKPGRKPKSTPPSDSAPAEDAAEAAGTGGLRAASCSCGRTF